MIMAWKFNIGGAYDMDIEKQYSHKTEWQK